MLPTPSTLAALLLGVSVLIDVIGMFVSSTPARQGYLSRRTVTEVASAAVMVVATLLLLIDDVGGFRLAMYALLTGMGIVLALRGVQRDTRDSGDDGDDDGDSWWVPDYPPTSDLDLTSPGGKRA